MKASHYSLIVNSSFISRSTLTFASTTSRPISGSFCPSPPSSFPSSLAAQTTSKSYLTTPTLTPSIRARSCWQRPCSIWAKTGMNFPPISPGGQGIPSSWTSGLVSCAKPWLKNYLESLRITKALFSLLKRAFVRPGPISISPKIFRKVEIVVLEN